MAMHPPAMSRSTAGWSSLQPGTATPHSSQPRSCQSMTTGRAGPLRSWASPGCGQVGISPGSSSRHVPAQIREQTDIGTSGNGRGVAVGLGEGSVRPGGLSAPQGRPGWETQTAHFPQASAATRRWACSVLLKPSPWVPAEPGQIPWASQSPARAQQVPEAAGASGPLAARPPATEDVRGGSAPCGLC